jgi:hypothetical protein
MSTARLIFSIGVSKGRAMLNRRRIYGRRPMFSTSRLAASSIGNDDLVTVQGSNLGRAQADLFDFAVVAFHDHPLTDGKWLVQRKLDAAEYISQRILRSQGDGQAGDTGAGHQRGDRDADLLHLFDDDHHCNDDREQTNKQTDQLLIDRPMLESKYPENKLGHHIAEHHGDDDARKQHDQVLAGFGGFGADSSGRPAGFSALCFDEAFSGFAWAGSVARPSASTRASANNPIRCAQPSAVRTFFRCTPLMLLRIIVTSQFSYDSRKRAVRSTVQVLEGTAIVPSNRCPTASGRVEWGIKTVEPNNIPRTENTPQGAARGGHRQRTKEAVHRG